MGLIKYSDFQAKLKEVGLTIGEITGIVNDDKDVFLQASIVGISKNDVPIIVDKVQSRKLYVCKGEGLFNLIYQLWHLATDQKILIKSNNLFTQVVEWDWGEGPNTGKFIKRTITKEELEEIPEFAKTV